MAKDRMDFEEGQRGRVLGRSGFSRTTGGSHPLPAGRERGLKRVSRRSRFPTFFPNPPEPRPRTTKGNRAIYPIPLGFLDGGAEGDRTLDLLNAMHAGRDLISMISATWVSS